jgi:hypothetical protein
MGVDQPLYAATPQKQSSAYSPSRWRNLVIAPAVFSVPKCGGFDVGLQKGHLEKCLKKRSSRGTGFPGDKWLGPWRMVVTGYRGKVSDSVFFQATQMRDTPSPFRHTAGSTPGCEPSALDESTGPRAPHQPVRT